MSEILPSLTKVNTIAIKVFKQAIAPLITLPIPKLVKLLIPGILFACPKHKVTHRVKRTRNWSIPPQHFTNIKQCDGCGRWHLLHTICKVCFDAWKELVSAAKRTLSSGRNIEYPEQTQSSLSLAKRIELKQREKYRLRKAERQDRYFTLQMNKR